MSSAAAAASRPTPKWAGAAALALVLVAPVRAEQFSGEVVGLADGDTVTVLDRSMNQHKVRLAGIDAPERSQAFGNVSRQHLAELVFRKVVVVDWLKHDRYGRIIGKVLIGDQDVNLAQVASGMAWHYKRFQNAQSLQDQLTYAAAEDRARALRIGLWKEDAPTAPWDYRRRR